MKKIIVSSLIFITVLASFLLFSSKQEKRFNTALTLFLAKDLISAEELIFDLEKEYGTSKSCFCKGFLALAKEDFENAQFYFQQALYQLHNNDEMLDLLLGKALACYQLRQIDDMASLLNLAENIDSNCSLNCPQVQFVRALYDYEKGNYDLFLKQCLESQKGCKKRNWTQGILDTSFSSSWIEIHNALAFIEIGRYQEGREILEKYIDSSHLAKNVSELSAFYLGYSYFKEAMGLAPSEKKSFARIALFYLEKSGSSFASHPKITSFFIEETAEQLKYDEGIAFFSLARILQKHKCYIPLEKAACTLSKRLFEQETPLLVCEMIRNEFSDSFLQECLVKNLIGKMQDEIPYNGKKAVSLWHCLQTITTNIPKEQIAFAIQLIEDKILHLIQKENEELPESLFYLSFLKILDPEIEEMNTLASSILIHGMQSWRKEHEEQKGLCLLKIALQLADDHTRPIFEKDIYDFFTTLYHRAQQANLVRRLGLLLDAFQAFNMSFKISISQDELANHVADAEFFYHSQDFQSAKNHAAWVMKLEPNNEEAIRCVGLASFHLGLYSEAFECLTKLSHHDRQVEEALALCETFFADASFAKVMIDNRLEIDCNN